jgi:DnaJ-class molecular chaperone
MTLALAVSAALLLAGGGYAVACWAFPFATCRRCAGTGTRTTWLRNERPCHYCKTTGRRVRLGRRLHTRATALHERGSTR